MTNEAHVRQGQAVIGSDDDLSPVRHRAIIWATTGLYIGPLVIIFNEMLITFFMQEYAFENVVCQMSAIFLGLNMLIQLKGNICLV